MSYRFADTCAPACTFQLPEDLTIGTTSASTPDELIDSTEEIVGGEYYRLLTQLPTELRLVGTQMLVVNALAYINEVHGEHVAETTVSAAVRALRLGAGGSQSQR